ncbi:toll-like receptor 4 [Mytilus trossulus]|uniref:toll-like receptor 4 n=1 Tax=Mytilus trossulus TaxID=6551 RepID=UPI003004B6F9
MNRHRNMFSDKTMSDLKTLEKLEIDIRAKSKKDIMFGEGYKYLINLSSLNIGLCYIQVFVDRKIFQFMPLLTNISFDMHCRMSIFPGGHQSLQSVRQLYVHHLISVQNLSYFNSFTNELKRTPIETLTFQKTFPNSLDYFPWNPISESFYNSSLKKLRMTGNKLYESFSSSKLNAPPSSLQELNLSSNRLYMFVLDLGNIRKLNLQKNLLGAFLSSHRYKRSRTINSKLEYIDLSMNHIEKLTFRIFQGQPNLKYINLSRNKLQKMTFRVSRLHYLRYLNLSTNNFTTLDKNAMENFDVLSKKTSFIVNLRNNALHCTCKTLPFLKWTTKTKVDVLINDNCTLGDGTIVSFSSIDSIIQQLQKGCTTYTSLIIGLTTVLAVILAVVVFALVYKYRWIEML